MRRDESGCPALGLEGGAFDLSSTISSGPFCHFPGFSRFPARNPSLSNLRPFNTLPLRSNDSQKVIDTHGTFVLFFLVFANQNLCRSASRTPAALRPPQFLHREKKHVTAIPLVSDNYKCPIAQLVSLHILTNAPGYGGQCLRS